MKVLEMGHCMLSNSEVCAIVKEELLALQPRHDAATKNAAQKPNDQGTSNEEQVSLDRQLECGRLTANYLERCYPAVQRADLARSERFLARVATAGFDLTSEQAVQLLNFAPTEPFMFDGLCPNLSDEHMDELTALVQEHLLPSDSSEPVPVAKGAEEAGVAAPVPLQDAAPAAQPAAKPIGLPAVAVAATSEAGAAAPELVRGEAQAAQPAAKPAAKPAVAATATNEAEAPEATAASRETPLSEAARAAATAPDGSAEAAASLRHAPLPEAGRAAALAPKSPTRASAASSDAPLPQAGKAKALAPKGPAKASGPQLAQDGRKKRRRVVK